MQAQAEHVKPDKHCELFSHCSKPVLTNPSPHEEFLQFTHESVFMVFPSSFEGFGMPPGEALMLEKPCICSNIPVLKEIYGDYVEYFREHDINQLAKKMKYLIENPAYRKKRGREGRRFVLQTYDWGSSARRFIKILRHYVRQN